MAYLAHADRFLGQGGSLAGVGFAKCDRTWTFDFDAKKWSDRAPATSPGGGLGLTCAYDPQTKKLWWGGKGLWSYDHDANTWTKHLDDEFYYHTGALDTKRGLFVVVGNNKLAAYDVRAAAVAKLAWPTSGGEALMAKSNPGFDYDPVTDRFVGWGGGAPMRLDPATQTWTTGSATGAAPEGSNGIYGRWRYVPGVNAFVVVTGWDTDVHFYKASAGGAAPAPVPPSPPPGSGGGAASSGADAENETCGCGASIDGLTPWWGAALAAAALLSKRFGL